MLNACVADSVPSSVFEIMKVLPESHMNAGGVA